MHSNQRIVRANKLPARVSVQPLLSENAKSSISAFFIYEDEPGPALQDSLDSVNAQRWSLLKLSVDDAIAISFRVIKLPSLILYNESAEETARVFGEQNIMEMIGRVFDE